MPEASRLDRRRETNSFHQSNMSQYVERYFHLLCVSGDMTLPYNLVYISNRIDKTRRLGKYHLHPTSMGSSLKPFSTYSTTWAAKTRNGNAGGKNTLLFISESYGTDRHLWCTSKKKHITLLSKCSPKRRIWPATDITKGTCCVQQLTDAHN